MLNRCEFIGNLGRDPEVRSTPNGAKVVNLSLGVTRKWKDAQGQQKEQTEWVRANVWSGRNGDGLAGVAERFLRKGSRCYIAGRMETHKWQDQQGNDRYRTEINVNELELLDPPRQQQGGQSGGYDQGGYGGQGHEPPPMDDDSEIPF